MWPQIKCMFLIILVDHQASVAMSSHKELDGAVRIGPYGRKDLQSCHFRTYHLTYAHYVKFPSWGFQICRRQHALKPGRGKTLFHRHRRRVVFIRFNRLVVSIRGSHLNDGLVGPLDCKIYFESGLPVCVSRCFFAQLLEGSWRSISLCFFAILQPCSGISRLWCVQLQPLI
jgi:hypothetical protein